MESIFHWSILWPDKFNKMIIIYDFETPLFADFGAGGNANDTRKK